MRVSVSPTSRVKLRTARGAQVTPGLGHTDSHRLRNALDISGSQHTKSMPCYCNMVDAIVKVTTTPTRTPYIQQHSPLSYKVARPSPGA